MINLPSFRRPVAHTLASLIIGSAAFLLAGCIEPFDSPGAADASSADGASPDAGPLAADGASPDAGPVADASTSDGGLADAGAGPTVDAAVADASATDAASADSAAPDASTSDGGGPVPVVSLENRVCQEGDVGEHFCSIPFRLSTATNHDVVVFVELVAASTTATAGVDFRISSFGVTVAAGQTTGEIPLVILGDRIVEPTEVIAYRLVSVTGATMGTSAGSILIIDDDSPAPPATATSNPLPVGRGFHTATALADGRVVLIGGYVNGAIVSSIDVLEANGTGHAFANPLPEPRSKHSATLLADGRILVVGGATQGSTVPFASTVLIDPSSGNVTTGPAFTQVRYGSSTVALADGRVLVAGGFASVEGVACLASAEIFVPRSAGTVDRVVPAENAMPSAGNAMAAVRAADGSVFFLGGSCVNSRKIVRYVPGVGFRLEAASLRADRVAASASLLPDGRIFVAGGLDSTNRVVQASTEILNATSATTIDGPTLAEARYDHRVLSLTDGRVVLSGGTFLSSGVRTRSTVEVFDSSSNTMRTPFTFVEPRAYHAVVRFNDRVLHLGGYLIDSAGARSLASYEVTNFGP